MGDDPLKVHLVWAGRRFPYYCRLAVESALVSNPSAEIHLHLIGVDLNDAHLARVVTRPGVWAHQASMPELFRGCPGGPGRYLDLLSRVPGGSPAAVSNLVRLAVLHREGGVYIDTDVVVVARLDDPAVTGSYVGAEWVWAANRARINSGLGVAGWLGAVPWAASCVAARWDSRLTRGRLRFGDPMASTQWHRLQVNNAVMGAPAGSAFVELALERALITDPSIRFALGPHLLDDVAQAEPETVTVHPPSRFYAISPGQSYRFFEDEAARLPADAQTIHYVASNHRRLLAELEHDRRLRDGKAPFWRAAREVTTALARSDERAPTRPREPASS